MDFEYHYSPEQNRFREEVRAWIAENVPPGVRGPIDPEEMSDELFAIAVDLRRKLGHKGWLYPTYPKEYGGGGLTPQHEMILQEETGGRRLPSVFSNMLLLPAILVWGTPEQKQKFLPGLFKGETIAFQNFTEPQSGSDLANIKSVAVQDGDDWLISGQKIFVSGGGPAKPNLLFGPIMTDPQAPRHRNLGYFLIPYPSQGLQLTPMRLLNGVNQNFVFMDSVRVPGDHLIGGDHQGWQVSQTTLEQEHGGRGQAFPNDRGVDRLISYARDTKHNGGTLGKEHSIRQQVVDSYIDSHIHSLLARRNYSMYTKREKMSYHGSQSSIWGKVYRMDNADRARDVMGPYALLGTKEPRAPFRGATEVNQRGSLTGAHPGGTIEIQKVIIARRLGISRTQERAAPTPATATSHEG